MLILIHHFLVWPGYAEDTAVNFEIREFIVEGNTLLSQEQVQQPLKPYAGENKSSQDVEKARAALEKQYRDKGWGTALVSIPPQTVDDGIVRLQVIEGRIGRVRVTGNRYNTRARILLDLKSLTPGTIPYIPDLQNELNRINSNRDIEVVPFLMPGKTPGSIDVELRVKDSLPLHGDIGLNNNSSHDTEPLRLNAALSYENLWQRGHAISFNYQVSPEDTEQVEAISGSYLFNPPWAKDHYLTVYGVLSNSDIATVGGSTTVGRGYIFGLRYIIPLWPYLDYYHNMTLGIDYKDFDEDIGLEEGSGFSVPVTYVPLSVNYSGAKSDSSGLTRLQAAVNMSLRVFADQEEFENKRFKAQANYIYLKAGLNRTQRLPAGIELYGGADGQVSDQPLISNEQYLAGGVDSVRGYKQAEIAGDNAFHWSFELRSPDLGLLLKLRNKLLLNVYGFYEGAWVGIIDPLPLEDQSQAIQGTGLGLRGVAWNALSYSLDWGYAIDETERTEQGTNRLYFNISYQF